LYFVGTSASIRHVSVDQASSRPPATARRSFGTRRSVRWLAALVTLVVAVGGAYWLAGSRQLTSYSSAQDSKFLLPVGGTDYISEPIGPSSTWAHDATVSLTSVKVVLADNSAHATFAFYICPTAYGGGSSGTISNLCGNDAKPLGDLPTKFDAWHQQVVLSVAPHQLGQVHIAGLQVSYQDGPFHGHQHTGLDLTALVQGVWIH
jgi:hypothetical protein